MLSTRDLFACYSVLSSWDEEYVTKTETKKREFRNLLDKQQVYLDSLRKNQSISEVYYQYRKDIAFFESFSNNLDQSTDRSAFSLDSLFLKYDSLIYFDFYRKLIDKDVSTSDTSLVQNKFDRLIDSPSYSNTVKKIIFQLFEEDLYIDLSKEDFIKRLVNYRNIT